MNKIYCYVRISTDKQIYDRQINVLKNAGYTKDNATFVEETYTGKKKSRPLFDEMIRKMQSGDTLVVESLSRLGRSLVNNNDIIDYLIHKKKVNVVILKENFNLKANGNMDSMTKLLLNIFNCFAEFERDQLSDRTREGMEAARERGTIIGAPRGKNSSIGNFIYTLELMINENIGQRKACSISSYPIATLKNDLKRYYEKYNTKDYKELLKKIKEEQKK